MRISRWSATLVTAGLIACSPAAASQGSVVGQASTSKPTPVAKAPPTTAPTLPTTRVTVAPAPTAPAVSGFNPRDYIGQGDAYNCSNFASQAQAQAVLRADPRDPNRLDTDKDGVACEGNPNPKDSNPVPR